MSVNTTVRYRRVKADYLVNHDDYKLKYIQRNGMLWFVVGRDGEERRAQRAEARGPVMKLHNADNKTKLTLVFHPPPPLKPSTLRHK